MKKFLLIGVLFFGAGLQAETKSVSNTGVAKYSDELAIDEKLITLVMTQSDHEAAMAFCQDLWVPKGPGYTKRAFVIGCIKKIIAGADPTI